MTSRVTGDLGPPLTTACYTRALTRSLECPERFALVRTPSQAKPRPEPSPDDQERVTPAKPHRGSIAPAVSAAAPRAESLLGRAISIGQPETNQPEVNWTRKWSAPVFLTKEPLLSFNINPQSMSIEK